MANLTNGFIFTWEIENFSMLPHQNGEYLESASFVDLYGVDWALSFYPRGKGEILDPACLLHAYLYKKLVVKVKFYFVLQATEGMDEIVSETFFYHSKSSPDKLKSAFSFFKLNEICAKKKLYFPRDILTLRCHFLPTDEAYPHSNANELDSERYFTRKNCVSRSGVTVQRCSVVWSIENVNKLGELVEKSFVSPLSISPGFKLSMRFRGIPSNEFVPIEIQLLDVSNFFVKCKLTVVSVNKEHQVSNESTHFLKGMDDVWQFPPFIKVGNLTRDKYLFPDNTLLLKCEVAFSSAEDTYEMNNSCMPLTLETRQNDTISELSTTIEQFYAIGKFCDVQLHAGGQTFPAHKLVLGARSPVFCAMFENDTKEKNSGVVEIEDVDPTTLKRMLAHLYEKDLKEDLSPEDMCKLYQAADKYDIASLEHRCRISLTSTLSVASVCDVLVLAGAHQDNLLLTAAYDFISRHADQVFYSSYWRRLMDDNVKLAAEFMHQMLTEKWRI